MTDIQEGISVAAAPTHYVTHTKEIIDHWISDEQLMMLSRGGKDKSFDVALAASGAALGFSQNFISLILEVSSGKPLAGLAVTGAFLFVIAATIAIVAFVYYKLTAQSVADLVSEIRARQPAKIA